MKLIHLGLSETLVKWNSRSCVSVSLHKQSVCINNRVAIP